jgi:hypothetical protein
MVEDTGAYDLVEGHLQLLYSFDRKLVNTHVGQRVFFLERLGMLYTGCAEINTNHMSRRPA